MDMCVNLLKIFVLRRFSLISEVVRFKQDVPFKKGQKNIKVNFFIGYFNIAGFNLK
jgi:hypothetical protein